MLRDLQERGEREKGKESGGIGAMREKGEREGEEGWEETIVMMKQVRLEKDVIGCAERGVTEGGMQ